MDGWMDGWKYTFFLFIVKYQFMEIRGGEGRGEKGPRPNRYIHPSTNHNNPKQAVATEGGATFLSVDASVIESKWLGESEKNAKAVFTLARRLAPCVIYLDEVRCVEGREGKGREGKGARLSLRYARYVALSPSPPSRTPVSTPSPSPTNTT
jgi:hypothetical protein